MGTRKINHAAVWIAIAAVQLFSFFWYSLFENFWREQTIFQSQLVSDTYKLGPIAVSLLASIVAMYALAWLFRRLGIRNWRAGLAMGLLVGIAFNVISLFSIHAFSTKPELIAFIDGGANALLFAVAGLILGAWPGPEEPRLQTS